MPVVKFNGKELSCKKGSLLRDVLIDHGMSPHNGAAKALNCFGLGTCGTCTVKITGITHPLTAVERFRLNLPPHRLEDGLRLSCQVRVNHSIFVEKGQGFWGQDISGLGTNQD